MSFGRASVFRWGGSLLLSCREELSQGVERGGQGALQKRQTLFKARRIVGRPGPRQRRSGGRIGQELVQHRQIRQGRRQNWRRRGQRRCRRHSHLGLGRERVGGRGHLLLAHLGHDLFHQLGTHMVLFYQESREQQPVTNGIDAARDSLADGKDTLYGSIVEGRITLPAHTTQAVLDISLGFGLIQR